MKLAFSVDVARDCIWQGYEQNIPHSLLETVSSLRRLSAVEKLDGRSLLTAGERASVSSMI